MGTAQGTPVTVTTVPAPLYVPKGGGTIINGIGNPAVSLYNDPNAAPVATIQPGGGLSWPKGPLYASVPAGTAVVNVVDGIQIYALGATTSGNALVATGTVPAGPSGALTILPAPPAGQGYQLGVLNMTASADFTVEDPGHTIRYGLAPGGGSLSFNLNNIIAKTAVQLQQTDSGSPVTNVTLFYSLVSVS